MMKRYLKLFIILVLCMIPIDVFGAVVQRHIVSVEKFDINDSNITIGGYAYISHRDNYGILEGSTVGNLSTYIVAYTGEWKDDYKYISKCNNNDNKSKCFGVKATLNDRDMYASRCMDDACYLSAKNKVLNYRLKNGFLPDSCQNSNDGSGIGYINGHHCLYSNVGFSQTIDLNIVTKRFFGNNQIPQNNDIKFKIVSTIKNSAGTILKREHSSLKIFDKICTVNNETEKCNDVKTENGNVKTGDYIFSFSGFSTETEHNAGQARPFKRDKTGKWSRIVDRYFYANDLGNEDKYTYPILDYKIRDNVSKGNLSYKDIFVQLDSKNSGTCYGESCVIADDNGSSSGADYWAPMSHLVFNDELKIMGFGLDFKPITCKDINNNKDKNNVTSIDVDCGSSKTLYQCDDKDNNITGKMYYKLSDNELKNIGSCKDNSNYYFHREEDDNYYLPISVNTDIIIEQTGMFTFSKLTPGTVNAGKGFSIGNGGITYENTIRWVVAKKYSNTNYPYYRYDATMYIENNGCKVDKSFDVNDLLSSDAIQNSNTNGKLYYYDSSGEWEDGNIRGASMGAITYELKGNGYFYTFDNNTNNDVDDKIKFISCDSNSSSLQCDKKLVDGIWNENIKWDNEADGDDIFNVSFNNNSKFVSGISYGISFSRTYNYSLPYAYVALKDTNYSGNSYKAGDVIYSQRLIDNASSNNLFYVDNKYFVGFKYLDRNNNDYDFPFNLFADVNPSLVKNMNWSLTGSCGVEVVDGYYKDSSGDGLDFTYNYRSIALDNPFPKANSNFFDIPINWRSWYREENNQNRIKKTYDNDPDYSIIISKLNNSNNVLISNINNITDYYGSLTGINPDGTSSFVKNNFNDIKAGVNNKYCGLGFFSTDCDAVN